MSLPLAGPWVIQASIIIALFSQVFPNLMTTVITFHQTYNTANIHRQPIKFLIDHQKKILLVVTILLFIGISMGLYGLWLVKS
jgi:hypothetical protein